PVLCDGTRGVRFCAVFRVARTDDPDLSRCRTRPCSCDRPGGRAKKHGVDAGCDRWCVAGTDVVLFRPVPVADLSGAPAAQTACSDEDGCGRTGADGELTASRVTTRGRDPRCDPREPTSPVHPCMYPASSGVGTEVST